MRTFMRAAIGLGALGMLAACKVIPDTSTGPEPVSAFTAGVTKGPAVATLNIGLPDAEGALTAFKLSCRRVTSRDDVSGLTRPEDWQGVCSAARDWPAIEATRFFNESFETLRISDGKAFATGYFEPEIAGSRTRQPGYAPVYAVPDDLTRGWPADIPESERTGTQPRGRVNEAGEFVRYYTRAEIEDGALEGRGLEIAWAKDPIELFFLQIQGSGRLRMDDGSIMRIGYASQNGRAYTGIGGLMRERGLLGDGPGQYPGSMQGIIQYLRENPEDGRALMRENESWVFFTELTGPGPLGSLGLPVTRENSVAVDPRYVPYGAPVYLDLDRDIADGLWVAQDTGGAIKGANRFDTFWGAGDDAREIAGGMTGRGTALILVPKGTHKRLKDK